MANPNTVTTIRKSVQLSPANTGGPGQVLRFSAAVDATNTGVEWGALDHAELTSIGSRTHAQIDTALDAAWQVLVSSGASQSTTNDTSWLSLINESIAGNALGANGRLRCSLGGRYNNNSGSGKLLDIRISFGGTVVYEHTATIDTDADDRAFVVNFALRNRNSTGSQATIGEVGISHAVASTTGIGDQNQPRYKGDVFRGGTSSADTTSAQTLLVEMRQQTTASGVVLECDDKLLEIFQAS